MKRTMAAVVEGELRLTSHYDFSDNNPYVIEQADPVVRIVEELVLEMERTPDWHPYLSFKNDVMTLRARNRTVVYVLERDSFNETDRTYRMHWPD